MRVQLWVLRTAGIMTETSNDKIVRLLPLNIHAIPDPGCGAMAFGKCQRTFDRVVVRANKPSVAYHIGHDRHGFGGAHGDIPTGAMLHLAVPNCSQLWAIRHFAIKHFAELVPLDLARQAKCVCTRTLPFARR